MQVSTRFLHAKLYARRGPSPAVVIGSANLTRVAFEGNLELNVVLRGDSPDDPRIRPFFEWIETLLAACDPLRRRDLLAPVRIATTVANWASKGRKFPARQVVRYVSLRTILVVAVVVWLLSSLPLGP